MAGRRFSWARRTGGYFCYAAFVADARLREIPAIQRRPLPQPLGQLAEEPERDAAILRAYASGGYNLQEIGDHFD